MQGIHLDAVPVDRALVAALDAAHMEKLAIVPRTVMGAALGADEPWLRMDAAYPRQMQERFRVLAEHRGKAIDRIDAPHVRAAEVELRNKVVSYLLSHYPEYFQRRGKVVSSPLTGVAVELAEAQPMEAVAALHNCDLLLMLPAERIGPKQKGRARLRVYRLMSGALAAPNGWSLRSHFDEAEPAMGDERAHDAWKERRALSLRNARLGKSVLEIHRGVVPHYDRYFADPVNRLFNVLPPGRGVWRRNWGLPMTDRLFLHADVAPPPMPEPTPDNMLRHGHVRSEHETFIRLPGSRAIVFGIQTYVWPLREVMANPVAFEALKTGHANLSPEMRAYRAQALAVLDELLSAQSEHAAG